MDLKPCPFCGNEAKFMSELKTTGHGSYDPCFWIECSQIDCRVSLSPMQTYMALQEDITKLKAELKNKWNERKNVPNYQEYF